MPRGVAGMPESLDELCERRRWSNGGVLHAAQNTQRLGESQLSAHPHRADTSGDVIVAGGDAYGMISSDAILSLSSLKKYRRSMGLPGKFPTRWLVTTIFPSCSSQAKSSPVY